MYAESNGIDLVDAGGLDMGGGCITEDFEVGVYHMRTICVGEGTNTDAGVTWSSGIGGTSGIKVGIGAGGQVPAGNSISDLEADAIVIEGSVRAGPGASVGYFQNGLFTSFPSWMREEWAAHFAVACFRSANRPGPVALSRR